jgi:hypothetical protein
VNEGEEVNDMKNSILILMSVGLVLGLTLTAEAVLIDRGGGMIYSTELNVTWLQDANFAHTSGYAPAMATDGQMTWNDANTWAQNLLYGGYDDWRLPTFDPAHAPDYSLLHEMAFLNYIELGNSRSHFVETGPFSNLPPLTSGGQWIEPWFWSGTVSDAAHAWRYDFTCG